MVAKKRDAATSLLQRLYAHMKLFDVDFVGGDFNMAVKGPLADVFRDSEFMAPGLTPLWGAGAPERVNTDCTGFLCMPRRPFHWFVNKHGVHTFSNDQLGLKERDESTHYPVFMHLWATNLPGGTRAALRSDAAQSRRRWKAATKNDRKRQRRLNQNQSGHCNRYRHSGTVAIHTIHAPSNVRGVVQCLSLRAQPHVSHCVDAMCELSAESLPDSEEDISHLNLSNTFLHIVTTYHIGNTLESCLIEEELGRVSLSCHFAVDCLCDNWYMPFGPDDNQ